MKSLALLFPLLLVGVAPDSSAEGFFVGGEVAPIVFWNECEYVIVCVDRTSNDGHSTGYGAYMGRWFSREGKSRTGLQVGYDKLGSIEGSESYDVYSGGFILPNMRRLTATWKHDASIIHAELIGGGSFSEERDSGAVFAKIGLYSASTKTVGSLGYGPGGGAYERKVSSAGLLIGTGYILPLAAHISARASGDMFFSVKVTDPMNAAKTLSEHLLKLSLGVDFEF